MYRIIGDVHGKIDRYIEVASGAARSIQLGDMGVGFPGEYYAAQDEKLAAFLQTGDHKFIRGNHDNPSTCKQISGWVPDGTVTDGIMHVGGAWSIDHAYRVMGFDMWQDEELSHVALNEMIDRYEAEKPRVMITHDCPDDVSSRMFFGPNWDAKKMPTRTGAALQAMLDIHQPEYWFFGHWHMTYKYQHPGIRTQFMCLGELDYIDIEL